MSDSRLPTHVIPVHYSLHLEPDLTAGTFAGRSTITLQAAEPFTTITFNAVELHLTHATLEHGSSRWHSETIKLDSSSERCHVIFPSQLPPKRYTLHLHFTGTLNDKLRGFYRSSYTGTDGTLRWLAATQFEATDARRAFPCWDEPALKAVFTISLRIDEGLTAISNSPIRSRHSDSGKQLIKFYDTISMSTYLVAFMVGELEGSPASMVGPTPIRIWSVPGKQGLTRFSQDIAAFSLRFFEDYYDIPYPGEKLDLIAIPDFASGAMENFGAITFRETALLIDPDQATHAEQERVADVVAHENAHMWFGDLVTMSWWNGLWLNEAFATFMEMMAVDAWKPEWERWTSFGVSRAAALLVDGLTNTRPIEYAVEAPHDADAMFDVLTYEKGASVLRMLEQFIGPEQFRAGVRDYLRTHAYRNADTQALWDALDRAAQQSIPELMTAWIFSKGYPVIRVDRRSPHQVTIRQERFQYMKPPENNEPEILWQVPLRMTFFSEEHVSQRQFLLTDAETTLPYSQDLSALLVNEGGHGFYRVQYAPDLLQPLVTRFYDKLSPIERFNLLNDAWAATVAGMMSLSDYLDLTGQFARQRDKNLWALLIESFQTLNRIISPGDRPALESFVQHRIHPLVEELGWECCPGENHLTRQLRGELLRALGTVGNDTATHGQALERLTAYDRNPASVDPNILPALVAILAYSGGTSQYENFHSRFKTAKTPQEERRYLYALAGFRDSSLLERTLEKTVNGEIRTQDAPFVVNAILMNMDGRDKAWTFVKEHWDDMDRLFPKQGLRRMCAGIVGLATPEFEEDVVGFFRSRNIDLGGKTLAQYLEQLHIAVAFYERNRRVLSDYVAQFKTA